MVEPYDYGAKTVSIDAVKDSGADWILFDDTDMLAPLRLGEGEVWDTWAGVISSCRDGYAVSPALYHSWLGSMVYAQSIGLLWLASVLWPASCAYDMDRRAQEFYDLFYGMRLTDKSSADLVGDYRDEVVPDE